MEFKEIQNTTINDLSSDTTVVGKDLLLLARQNFTKRNVVDREFPYYSFKTSVSELSAATEFALVHKNENVKGYWTFNNPVSVDNYTLSGKVDNNVVATKWYADRMEKDITDRIYALSNYLYDEENPHIPSYVGMIVVTSIKDEKRIKEIYGGNKWQLTCQNRFLVGASKTASEYLLDHKGGHNSIKLKASQCGVPFHVHDMSISNTQTFNTADYSHGLPQITPNKNPHRKHSHLHDYLIAAGVCAAIVAVIVVGTICTAGTGGPGLFSAGGSAIASALGATAGTVGATAAAAASFIATAVLTAAVTTALTYLGQQILIKTTELSMESINQWLAGAQLVSSVITFGYGLYNQLGELARDFAIQNITKNISMEIVKKMVLTSLTTSIQCYGIYKQIHNVRHPSNQRMHFSQTYKQFADKKFWINLARDFVIQQATQYFKQEIARTIGDKIMGFNIDYYNSFDALLNKLDELDLIYYWDELNDNELIQRYETLKTLYSEYVAMGENLQKLIPLVEQNKYTIFSESPTIDNFSKEEIDEFGGYEKAIKLIEEFNKTSPFVNVVLNMKRNLDFYYNDDAKKVFKRLITGFVEESTKRQSLVDSGKSFSFDSSVIDHMQYINESATGSASAKIPDLALQSDTSHMAGVIENIERNEAIATATIAAAERQRVANQFNEDINNAQGQHPDLPSDETWPDEQIYHVQHGDDGSIYTDDGIDQWGDNHNSDPRSFKLNQTILTKAIRAEKTKEEIEEEEKKKQADEDRGTDAVDPRTTFYTVKVGSCPISVSVSAQKGFLKNNSSASAAQAIDLRPRYYRVYIWKRTS